MTQIRTDLWETRTDAPFPGLSTHAHMWTPGGRNALFYCPAGDAGFRHARFTRRGRRPLSLSHQTRQVRCWRAYAGRFGSRLHAGRPPNAHDRKSTARSTYRCPPGDIDDRGCRGDPHPGRTPGSTELSRRGRPGPLSVHRGHHLPVAADGRWSSRSGRSRASATRQWMAESRAPVGRPATGWVGHLQRLRGARGHHPFDEGTWPAASTGRGKAVDTGGPADLFE